MINNFLEPELRGYRLITKMCGFSKVGTPLTLPEPQWLLFESCSLIASFHDVMFPGLLGSRPFNMQFFSVVLPQVTCIQRQATNIRRKEGRHSQANRDD